MWPFACLCARRKTAAVALWAFGLLVYISLYYDIPFGPPKTPSKSTTAMLTRSDDRARDYGSRTLNKLFHVEETDKFARYIRFNVTDEGKQCKGRRFLVYTCKSSCGGWGDRLKGITTLFLLAQLTNRTFLIDMPTPCELHTLVKPNVYDWHKCLVDTRAVSSNETIHFNLMKGIQLQKMDEMIHGELGRKKVFSVQTNVLEIQKIRNHTLSHDAMPWLRNLSDAEVWGSIIGILFKPSQTLSDALIKFKTETVRERLLVCSHIRVGKSPTIPNEPGIRDGTPNVSRVLNFIKNYDTLDNVAIFVATDSVEVRNQSRKLFFNFISSERRIIHVDNTKGTRNELCEGFFAALLDQLILSRCDVLVMTRSNFGAMAAYMRGESENLFLNVKNQKHIVNATVSGIQDIYRFV